MRLQGLLQPLQENDKFITAINSIKNKKFPINISGLSDSGKSYIIDGIFNEKLCNEVFDLIEPYRSEEDDIYA